MDDSNATLHNGIPDRNIQEVSFKPSEPFAHPEFPSSFHHGNLTFRLRYRIPREPYIPVNHQS